MDLNSINNSEVCYEIIKDDDLSAGCEECTSHYFSIFLQKILLEFINFKLKFYKNYEVIYF